jgi:hypothetical protein
LRLFICMGFPLFTNETSDNYLPKVLWTSPNTGESWLNFCQLTQDNMKIPHMWELTRELPQVTPSFQLHLLATDGSQWD